MNNACSPHHTHALWGYELIKNNRRLRELNISPLDAFRLLTLISDALPLEWWEGLKAIHYVEDEPFNIHEIKLNLNEQTVLIKTAASIIVYKELQNRIITPPTAQLKFNAKFVDDFSEWKKILQLAFSHYLRYKVTQISAQIYCSTDVL